MSSSQLLTRVMSPSPYFSRNLFIYFNGRRLTNVLRCCSLWNPKLQVIQLSLRGGQVTCNPRRYGSTAASSTPITSTTGISAKSSTISSEVSSSSANANKSIGENNMPTTTKNKGLEMTFYQLVCRDPAVQDTYVGMSKLLGRALARHRSKSKDDAPEHGRLLYQVIRDTGSWDNWEARVLETSVFPTFLEALIRKQHWVDQLQPKMNTMSIPYKGRKFISSPFFESNEEAFTYRHSNPVVYQLICKDKAVSDTYIGVTTDLPNALRTHRGKYDNAEKFGQRKLYETIREKGGWNSWEFKILEELAGSGEDTSYWQRRKAYWCDLLRPSLNSQTASWADLNTGTRHSVLGVQLPSVASEVLGADSSVRSFAELVVEDNELTASGRAHFYVYKITHTGQQQQDENGSSSCSSSSSGTDTASRSPLVYVGTARQLSGMLRRHMYYSGLPDRREKPLYRAVEAYGGWGAWRVTVLEACEYTDKQHTVDRKTHWAGLLGASRK